MTATNPRAAARDTSFLASSLSSCFSGGVDTCHQHSCHTSTKHSNPTSTCPCLVLFEHNITKQSSSRAVPVVRSLTCRSRDRSVPVAARRLPCPSAPLPPFCWRNERAYWRGAQSDSVPAHIRARACVHAHRNGSPARQGTYTRTNFRRARSRNQVSLPHLFELHLAADSRMVLHTLSNWQIMDYWYPERL